MTVFAVNFIAIVPLALLLGRAADESILRTEDVVGALINTTFGSVISLGYVLKGWCQASSDLVLIDSVMRCNLSPRYYFSKAGKSKCYKHH